MVQQKINETVRYHRQQLIDGWDQEKLAQATVSIVGSDFLAKYVAIPLAALGVGKIRIIDSAQGVSGEEFLDFCYSEAENNPFPGMNPPLPEKRVHWLEEKLKLVNPNVKVLGLASSLVGETSKYFLEQSDLVIETTNSPQSKSLALEFSQEARVPILVASCRDYYGKFAYSYGEKSPRHLLHEFEKPAQDELVSLILGGAIAEEAKKTLMKEPQFLNSPFYYNFMNPLRFDYSVKQNLEPRKEKEFSGKKVLIIGAGALGNFVGLGLARLGVGQVDVIDYDFVEDTNLNRQVLYYDAVGQEKARALSKKIVKMGGGRIQSMGMVDKFTEKSDFAQKYDLLFDCLDSFVVRAVLNDYALRQSVPLISGGTDFRSGQVVVYVPGKTSCLDCRISVQELGRRAEERRRRMGCLEAPNPSVIMTNQVTAGIMVHEALTVFCPEKYGAPLSGIIKYGANLEPRGGMNPVRQECHCAPKNNFVIPCLENDRKNMEKDQLMATALNLGDELVIPLELIEE